MRGLIGFIFGAILGAAAGAYVAKSITEKKVEDKIEKATLEAREYYKEKYKPKEEPKKEEKKVGSDALFRVYGRAYDIYSEPEKPAPDPDKETYAYEIPVEEYGEDPDYTTYSLDYYADGNLVDETGNIVDDPVHLVGGDVLDSVCMSNPTAYVRNDITKTDYEICFVNSEYEEPGGVKD